MHFSIGLLPQSQNRQEQQKTRNFIKQAADEIIFQLTIKTVAESFCASVQITNATCLSMYKSSQSKRHNYVQCNLAQDFASYSKCQQG
jgi:hypothetical protein